MNPEIKNPFASKTIWGSLLVVVSLLGRAFGIDVPKDEISGLIDLISANWDAFTSIIGVILTIWGRFTANKKIGFSK